MNSIMLWNDPSLMNLEKKMHFSVGKNINCLQMKNMFTKTSKSKLKMLSSLINCIMSKCQTVLLLIHIKRKEVCDTYVHTKAYN